MAGLGRGGSRKDAASLKSRQPSGWALVGLGRFGSVPAGPDPMILDRDGFW